LPGYCGDPNVIIGNHPANLREFRFDLTVHLADVPIRQQKDGGSQEIADQRELYFPALSSQCTVVEFLPALPMAHRWHRLLPGVR
jgi:hypothetical protein